MNSFVLSRRRRNSVVGLALSLLSAMVLGADPGPAHPPASPLALWYRQPARRWLEALPVGNGRLGAMVFGGVTEDRLELNEITFWSGGVHLRIHPAIVGFLVNHQSVSAGLDQPPVFLRFHRTNLQ